jgi:CRISPR-associated endonuclease/helicase Cas3
MSIDFATAFAALTVRRPFRWQERLFNEFARGETPKACDIPTGLGKTSVIAIWLSALDLHASNLKLPRRLVYVVDRRAVVDQATAEAEMLAKAIGDGRGKSPDPAIEILRERLLLGPGRRLPISTLRGQLADNRVWLEDPSSPAIVVGTVDMIGSRLLFQGYGVSSRMRPLHAALLGADALVVLDEAHLVPPFEALVRQVEELANEHNSSAPLTVPKLRLMTLSATGRRTPSKPFGLQPEDEEKDEVVRKRLNAPKRLTLELLPGSDNVADKLAERAWERGANRHRVIIFCDSRKVAKIVYDQIEKKLEKSLKDKLNKDAEPAHFIELIVGARRVREREKLAKSIVFRRFAHKLTEEETSAAVGWPAFLIATSAGEVGVDIDAEHMVCDLVAWERMVQRLGRVNRLGQFSEGSLIDVFAVESEKDKETETPADADRIKRWRTPFESVTWTVGDDGRYGASPGELRRLQAIDDFRKSTEDATTAEPLRPNISSPARWSIPGR